jgi:acetyl esterase/lipase
MGRLAILVAGLMMLALGAAPSQAATSHLSESYDIDTPPPASQPGANLLDIYGPDGVTPRDRRPVVVYVHGGAWAFGDKTSQIRNMIGLFTGAGYVFVSLNHRLSPFPANPSDPNRIKFPDHPHDVGEAIGWLSRHIADYGGDPTRILLIGHSAGAHLVSLVSTDPSYAAAYGVAQWELIGTVSLDSEALDVPTRIAGADQTEKQYFYNAFGTASENAAGDLWARASPINWAGPMDPPFLLVTQAAVPSRVAQNQRMAAALASGPGASVFLAPYDHLGINDAVGSPTDSAGETAAIMSFFARAVALSNTPKVKLRGHPPRFNFKSNVAGASFRCRLDRHKFKPCRSPRRVRAGAGRHKFRIQAISPRGRPGPTKTVRFRLG